jgi:hypothetical protein
MKQENLNPDDAKLRALLQTSRVSAPLPPRFQENVWRRIEDAEAPAKSESWLDVLTAFLLRPKFAVATVAALMLAGALLGTNAGAHLAKQDAQVRYLAAVAPNSLR